MCDKHLESVDDDRIDYWCSDCKLAYYIHNNKLTTVYKETKDE